MRWRSSSCSDNNRPADLPGVLLSGPQVSDVLVRNHNMGRSGATEAGYRHVERA